MGYDGGLRAEGPIADFDGFCILCFHMVRKYKRKSDRDTWSVEGIIAAMLSETPSETMARCAMRPPPRMEYPRLYTASA